MRQRQESLTVDREPVILAGGYRPGDLLTGEEPFEELEQLVETAGARVVGKVVQKIRQIRADTYIGPGKVEEIKELAKQTKARCILFDHELSPAQGRNLDKELNLKVMDRTDLILDIFASRAHTQMAKIQVSLAMNQYRLPRLRRLWTHLERQEGGIGMRGGPGERQIETDRRKLLKTIHDLEQELALMSQRKERMVADRKRDNYLVSLVGYTNAGKSTLMKALTGEDVFIEDKLFATLDTKTATVELGGGLKVLLSDTVGFIRRLPHNLVASFHATLEEARCADLLLHVVDVSSPHAREQILAVNSVLKEIGADRSETLMVLNKIDAVKPELEIQHNMLREEYPDAVSISALRMSGIPGLKEEIRDCARSRGLPVQISVHAGDGRTLAYLATHFFEDWRKLEDEWIILRGRATPAVIDRLKASGPTVRLEMAAKNGG